MTPDERALLLSPFGIAALQTMILDTCRRMGEGRLDVPTGDTALQADFIEARTPESKSALNETYQEGQGFVTFAELSAYLTDNATSPSGKDKWSRNEVSNAIAKTFPSAKRDLVKGEGKGYANLRKR